MSITIKEVENRKELLRWVRFPTVLYKDNEYYVPFLENDEIDTFSEDKNPAFAFCDVKMFLAYKDDEIVGRIAAIINRAYIEKWGKKAIRFTRFDFINDYEVSAALLGAVEKWALESGLESVTGPIGFTDMDHEGMLVEGFEELNMSITFYNFPYYLTHMERLGLVKDIDWIEYKITVPDEINPIFERITEHLINDKGFSVTTYTDRKALYTDAFEAFALIDVAFSKLYGTVPLTPEVIKNAIDSYIPLVKLDYICSVRDSEGRIIGFGALVPSIARALKKSNGRLFPFGIVRMLTALKGKNDTLEMFFVAVDPKYRMQGIPAIIISTLLKKLIDNGVKYCETGPMLETNGDVHSLWAYFNKRQHKRRRCFVKSIV